MKRIPLGLITLSVVLSIFAVAVMPGLSKKAAAGACIGPTCPNVSPLNTLGPNLPDGFIEYASCTTATGWASDFDNPAIPIAVHIYIDDVFSGDTLADVNRLDVGNHGWSYNIPPARVNDKLIHTIKVYGIDINGTGAIPIVLSTGLPVGNNLILNTLPGSPTPMTIGPCTKTCKDGSVIAIAGVCTQTCKDGSIIAETSTCTITCKDGSVIAETSTCPRAPTLSISSFDCTAIVFASQDPDSPATKLAFLVGRSKPVVFAPPDLVDGGTGGTWTIPASEKNASSHAYYILVAGVASDGKTDGVNTTSLLITIPICAPAPPPPPPPRAPTLSISSFDCTAIVFTSQDPDSPATKLAFLVGRSTPVGLLLPGLVGGGAGTGGTWTIPASEKNASSHAYYILVAGVDSLGALDTVDTTSPLITIPVCVPAPPPPPPPRAPTLSISSFDCTAIVFTSQDPDSPATKLAFLVGRSKPVVFAPPDLVDAGFVNPGGTWTIPASEKNASSHSYYILVAGVDSLGALDTVNTTSPLITIPVCVPAPPPPPPPVVVNCADGPHPAPYTCPVPPFIPPPPVLAFSFKDLFKDTCKNAEGIATVCKDRDVLQSASCNSIFGTCGIIGKGISLISILIGLAAVVMIMIGGFKYVASAGDPNQAATARRTVLFAAIGVAISILAQGFIRLVINRL